MENVAISKSYTLTQKRRMLVDVIELCYKTGTNATIFVGHSLAYYNFDKVLELIKELSQEVIDQGGDDFFEYKESYPNAY